ncbi:type III secretion system effector E3 ubiquitin transferase SspH1 [Salmonella enterica]|uniref:RING-type E3 ubiquitin transferase n=1 Tax=Salmonella enterica subsp. enterica serovar 4,[5],12:b:- TaxID=1340177 RepID=A0A730C390_SALET|nr:type III secretion system effector E3 ubiquitin transferase SspH1 [Salmonella enterica]ECV2755843.1 type III secretion system effector E3 ubiquitin transferase SspH1 [Salmonella enterica subsp. enterica serovar 4,[5],12:b:-]EAQ7618118.1 type III secretion system effector E3 ubiquitin transferase SspH1 [Salmonella enterica]EAZ7288253.1 type III secretion system effector E3 ubiquitin transferase SspH1 [Salmonella enterica]EBA8491332.1 type III secretion system effector E3 ubiquitin transferase
MFNIRNTQPSVSMQAIAGAAAPEASPEEIVWEKIQVFFPQENYEEAQQCLAELCHPARGMLPDHISSQFARLKALTFPAWEENIQCNRDGINQFCILDAGSKEILSITLDDAGNYTVNCQGYSEAHDFIMDTEPGEECTEFAEGASGTSLRPATTVSQKAAEYDAVWSKWERDAPAGESPGRAAVVQEMRDCLNNGNPVLNVGASGLTTLPDRLPPHITTLVIPDNNLTSLPELPEGLRELEVSGNLQLTSLPSLPQGLQKLRAYNNWLASLPTLPPGLGDLAVSNNQLTSLPEMPPALRELRVSGNNLTSLPALPSGLQKLWAYNNRLTSLPEMSPGLQELDVSHNQLTRLPQSLTGLSSAARVYLDGNPLSVRTLQALRDIIGHSGIRIHFDMAGPSVPREARALHLAVADWLTSAREGEAAQADRWQTFGLEDNAAAFSLVLDRLRETENFKKDAGFKAQISSWLKQLAEDAALRAKTFAMATEATSTCEDRVTHALHQMNNVQLVHNAEKGEYDNNLQGLVSTGREMFRLATLEQIAREKAGTLALVDDVEVYLAFQNKLKESLELTSVTSEMRFFDVSGVTVSDLQAAELQVKTAENSGFSKWILQWGPLHSVLERKVPERFNALREKQISDYEDTYRKLYDEVLKSSGLVDDTDAERTIGVSAMDSAKKEFLDGLRALVDEVLGSYLTARWRLN